MKDILLKLGVIKYVKVYPEEFDLAIGLIIIKERNMASADLLLVYIVLFEPDNLTLRYNYFILLECIEHLDTRLNMGRYQSLF